MGFLRRYSRLLPFQRCICFIRGLSSWQRAALAWTWWYLVSQRRPQRGCGWFAGSPQRHFSGQLCLSGGCSSCQFSAVTVKTASVSYFIQIYSSCAFIRLFSIAVLVRKWSFFPASQDFFPGACFCRSFSVGAVTQSEMLILFGAELELVLSPCPGCCRRFWTGSPWPGKHLRETTGGFVLHAFNQVATFWEDKHPPHLTAPLWGVTKWAGVEVPTCSQKPVWPSSPGGTTHYPTRSRAFTLQERVADEGMPVHGWPFAGCWLCPSCLQTHRFCFMVIARNISSVADG